MHEAAMHPKNAFITLTYDDKHLPGPKLYYPDWQNFMKRLRKLQNEPMAAFMVGEYGDQTKRPHWHAIIFNWQPTDGKYKYSNKRGDRVFSSETLTKVWGKGTAEYGSVTFNSAGYCARYAAKKLVHGSDQEHDFHPISKKPQKYAVGKTWLEKNWPDVFNHGQLIILKPDGTSATSSIPRYYEKWLKENQPDAWMTYVTSTKQKKITYAARRAASEASQTQAQNVQRAERNTGPNLFPKDSQNRAQARKKILKEKFKRLQDFQKL